MQASLQKEAAQQWGTRLTKFPGAVTCRRWRRANQPDMEGIASASESEAAQDSRMAVLAKRSSEGDPQGKPASVGKCVPSDPRHSEGEAGHNKRVGGTAWGDRTPESVSTKLNRITEMAKRDAGFVFTNLIHLIDESFLWEAHRRIRKDGASGVDGETAESYAEALGENIRSLHRRMKSGRYRAPAVKRGWIPKDDGEQRPIGIPSFEDKIVQKAVAMVLDAILEVDFSEVSYGFRWGRSAHDALTALRGGCLKVKASTIIDADIKGYFDAIDHKQLVNFLKRRVNDGMLLRFIGKWLKAGVMDGEEWIHPETGTPQGGIISPVLANVYLHYVLDLWIEEQVKPVMAGRVFLVRYADDFILGFEFKDDARRVLRVLAKRFAKFGLTIHPEKTRCVSFAPPRAEGSRPESFDFLGFTHYWGKSLKGHRTIKRRTSGKRQRRAMTRIWQWCRERMHEPLRQQWEALVSKLRGHYQYYGIIGNYKQMEVYYEKVIAAWRHWLNRRNSKDPKSAKRFAETILEQNPLPVPRIMKQV